MSESIIAERAYIFALKIVKAYKFLVNEKKEFVLSKQLLRSGTGIGANVNEAISSQSKRDFIYKLGIALKEARETKYWLRLLKDSDYFDLIKFAKLNNDCEEIIKILSSIILTTKARYFKNPGATHNS